MTGYSGWSHQPFRPFDYDRARPVVVRLTPGQDGARLAWRGSGPAQLCWAERGSDSYLQMAVQPGEVTITGLKDQTEYELYLDNGKKSDVRLLRTGKPIGTIVNYLHPDDRAYAFSGQYLGSPSLLRLPGGTLLASMDYFHREGGQNCTQLFRSQDDGASWNWLTDLYPCFWGKLFLHRDALYMLAVSAEYGDLLVGRSGDGGRSWGTPAVIARGGAVRTGPGFHRAPTCPALHGGRLWFSAEFGAWQRGYHASLTLSINEDSDLLEPVNWTLSPPVRIGVNAAGDHIIEGNLVTAQDGGLVNILRHGRNKAVILRVDSENPAAPQRFEKVLDFPLGDVKFELLPCGGGYIAAGNPAPARNILAVYSSADLLRWEHVTDIVNCADRDPGRVGFQYPSCLLEGGRLLALSRSAWNGAASHHDSNMMTFHAKKI